MLLAQLLGKGTLFVQECLLVFQFSLERLNQHDLLSDGLLLFELGLVERLSVLTQMSGLVLGQLALISLSLQSFF
jgi:hypothetical protein